MYLRKYGTNTKLQISNNLQNRISKVQKSHINLWLKYQGQSKFVLRTI